MRINQILSTRNQLKMTSLCLFNFVNAQKIIATAARMIIHILMMLIAVTEPILKTLCQIPKENRVLKTRED